MSPADVMTAAAEMAAAAADRRADWVAACDRYEMALDTGKTAAAMAAMAAAASDAYDRYIGAQDRTAALLNGTAV